MKKYYAGITLSAIIVSTLVVSPLAFAIEDEMGEIIELLISITDETIATLDIAWDIALNFKDPNYQYDPSELILPNSLSETNKTR